MGRAGKCTREVVWPRNRGRGGLGFGGKRVEVPCWYTGLNGKNGEEAIFIVILLGFPGPSDGLRLHPIVFFSSGSGLTADSSVLTLTLTFLDFGLDFAQSFPFHAQFCHFGLRWCRRMVMVVVLAGGNGDVGDDVYGVEMVVGSGGGVVMELCG
ncbi:hypothetical protein Tco_0637537 [Tanacetum coccineum]